MNNDYENDLEKTKSLNDLTDLIAKETEDYLPEDNNSLEDDILNNMGPTKEELYNNLTTEVPNIIEDTKTKKITLKEKWHNLTKQQKIILIVSLLVIFLFSIIITTIVLINDSKQKEPVPDATPEVIVIDNGNYRYENGTLKFLNDNKTEIGSYECTNEDENLCYVAYLSNNEDNFDTIKNIYEDGSEVKIRSQIYNNRYVFLVDGEEETVKLYDILEQKSINEYTLLKTFDDSNQVIVKDKNNKYGLLEITSNEIKTIIEPSYEYMGIIPNKNKIIVKTTKASYLIDKNNKYLTKQLKGDIIDYNDTYVLVKNNNTYEVVDYNNQSLITNEGYIKLINEDYVGLVIDNNLYIRGYGNNKYNEVGYRLYNDNYYGLNTYNKEGIQKSSSYAFKVSVNESMATIYIKNNDKTEESALNLKDGEASSYKKYYSYFDGILYFYSDEEKTNLIGNYPCQNKNTFEDNLDFNHCNVAYDNPNEYNYKNQASQAKNLLPIYNNRFVFITDTLDINQEETKLYDFTTNKVIATYATVNASVSNNDGILTLVDNQTNIIVKNKSNKYGMISLSSNGLSKIYDFIYDEMERIGDNIQVKQNDKYKIMFAIDSSSASYPAKIYDYNQNYYIIKETNGYAIYDTSANKVINKNYKFIKMLGDTCFGYIGDDNKLYVSLYDGTTINTTGIDIDIPTNELDYLKLFTLTKLNNEVIVNVFNLDGSKKDTKNISLNIIKEEENNNDPEE